MLNTLIFLFGLLLPSSWAKHWLITESLVNGVLVDYLMPDLWVQDIIALAIIVFSVIQLRVRGYGFLKILTRNPQTRNPITLELFSGILILISVIFSPIPLVSMINFIRFLLAMSVSWIIFKNKSLHRPVLLGLSGAVIWSALLAFAQFVKQGTVVGWRFLGEPIYSLGSGGVKKISLANSQLVAPMATFPHANVMGAFGLLSFLFFRNKDQFFCKLAKYFSLVLIVLSFSIPIYLSLFYLIVCQLFCTIVHNNRQADTKIKLISFFSWGILSLVSLIVFYKLGIIKPNSIYRRWSLIKSSVAIIKARPLVGVGWGTFVKSLPDYSSQLKFLQPVHNVFLLVLSELGVLGTSGLLLLVREYLRTVKLKNYCLLITVYLLLFTFDHYFWTTTQGLYLLWVMIALF